METPPHYWRSRPRENQFFSRRADGPQHPSKHSSSSLKVNTMTWISITTLLPSQSGITHKQVCFDGLQLPATPSDDLGVLCTYPCSEKPPSSSRVTETTRRSVQQDPPELCWCQTLLLQAAQEAALTLHPPFYTFPPSKVKLPISGSGWLIVFSENLDKWTMLLKSFIVYWT